MKKYITFDSYYTHTQYNDFLLNLRANKIIFEEFVCIKPPYQFYIYIEEKYLPVFLKYNIATSSLERYMLNKIRAYYPNEEYTLLRRQTDNPASFEKFVSPIIFRELRTANYACVFRYKNKEELIKISKGLGVKVWDLGRHREWNLGFTFSKMIKNYVNLSWIVLEKTDKSQYSKPGEFEATLNFNKLNKTKLANKYEDYPYYDDGIYYGLKITS